MPLDNHLRNSLATQCLAANKVLLRDGCEGIERSGKKKEHSSSYQTRGSGDKADPLDSTKYHVDAGAHPVGGKATNERVEFRGRGTDSEEEWNFNEEDNECRSTNIG